MEVIALWLIRLGLVAIFATPLLVTPSTVFPFIVGKALYSRSIIEVVFGLWVFLAVRRPEYRPARSWLLVILGFFVFANLLSAFFGVSFQRSFWSNYERMTGVFDQLHWLALTVVLLAVVKGAFQWRILFNLLVGSGLLIALLGVAQKLAIHMSAFPWLRPPGADERITSSLGNATYVGSYMMVTFLLTLGLLAESFRARQAEAPGPAPQPDRRRRRRRRVAARPARASGRALLALRVYWVATALAALWVMAEAGSRGAFLGLVAGLVVAGLAYGIWSGRQKLRVPALAAAAVVAVLAGAFLLLRSTSVLEPLRNVAPIFTRTVGATGNEGSARAREIGSRISLEAFVKRPITGWGVENFSVPFNRFTRGDDFVEPFPELDQAHDKPLEILATTGIIGFGAYVALWLWVYWLVLQRIRKEERARPFAVFAGGALVGYLAHLLFLFDTSATFMLFIFLAAWAGTYERPVAERAAVHVPGDVLVPRAERTVAPAPRRRVRAARGGGAPPTIRDTLTGVALPAALAVLMGFSLWYFNARAWQAAQKVLVPGTPSQITENLSVFPPLSTFGRHQFIESVSRRWQDVPPNQREDLLKELEPHIEAALAAEPDNLKLRISVSKFYRLAASAMPSRRDELLAIARKHADEALRIGPHKFAAQELQFAQAEAERNVEKAREAVRVWKEDHPRLNKYMRPQFDKRLARLEQEAGQ